MKRRTLLLLAIAKLSASFLHADTIFSNVGTGIPSGQGALIYGASWEGSAGYYYAVAFEFTPTATAAFSDALVDLYTLPAEADGSDSSVTASLYSNGDFEAGGEGHLGSLLAQLDTATAPSFELTPSLPFESFETSFTQISGPAVTLVAGTTYWLELAPGDADSFSYIDGGAETAPLITAFTESGPGTFTGGTSTGAEIEIDGAPSSSSTPESASLALLVSGLPWLFAAPPIRHAVARRMNRAASQ